LIITYNFAELSNEDLQLLQPFNCDVYELIMCFLQRLTPPVCFAAHNGNGFDYPIFLWELKCINKVINLYNRSHYYIFLLMSYNSNNIYFLKDS